MPGMHCIQCIHERHAPAQSSSSGSVSIHSESDSPCPTNTPDPGYGPEDDPLLSINWPTSSVITLSDDRQLQPNVNLKILKNKKYRTSQVELYLRQDQQESEHEREELGTFVLNGTKLEIDVESHLIYGCQVIFDKPHFKSTSSFYMKTQEAFAPGGHFEIIDVKESTEEVTRSIEIDLKNIDETRGERESVGDGSERADGDCTGGMNNVEGDTIGDRRNTEARQDREEEDDNMLLSVCTSFETCLDRLSKCSCGIRRSKSERSGKSRSKNTIRENHSPCKTNKTSNEKKWSCNKNNNEDEKSPGQKSSIERKCLCKNNNKGRKHHCESIRSPCKSDKENRTPCKTNSKERKCLCKDKSQDGNSPCKTTSKDSSSCKTNSKLNSERKCVCKRTGQEKSSLDTTSKEKDCSCKMNSKAGKSSCKTAKHRKQKYALPKCGCSSPQNCSQTQSKTCDAHSNCNPQTGKLHCSNKDTRDCGSSQRKSCYSNKDTARDCKSSQRKLCPSNKDTARDSKSSQRYCYSNQDTASDCGFHFERKPCCQDTSRDCRSHIEKSCYSDTDTDTFGACIFQLQSCYSEDPTPRCRSPQRHSKADKSPSCRSYESSPSQCHKSAKCHRSPSRCRSFESSPDKCRSPPSSRSHESPVRLKPCPPARQAELVFDLGDLAHKSILSLANTLNVSRTQIENFARENEHSIRSLLKHTMSTMRSSLGCEMEKNQARLKIRSAESLDPCSRSKAKLCDHRPSNVTHTPNNRPCCKPKEKGTCPSRKQLDSRNSRRQNHRRPKSILKNKWSTENYITAKSSPTTNRWEKGQQSCSPRPKRDQQSCSPIRKRESECQTNECKPTSHKKCSCHKRTKQSISNSIENVRRKGSHGKNDCDKGGTQSQCSCTVKSRGKASPGRSSCKRPSQERGHCREKIWPKSKASQEVGHCSGNVRPVSRASQEEGRCSEKIRPRSRASQERSQCSKNIRPKSSDRSPCYKRTSQERSQCSKNIRPKSSDRSPCYKRTSQERSQCSKNIRPKSSDRSPCYKRTSQERSQCSIKIRPKSSDRKSNQKCIQRHSRQSQHSKRSAKSRGTACNLDKAERKRPLHEGRFVKHVIDLINSFSNEGNARVTRQLTCEIGSGASSKNKPRGSNEQRESKGTQLTCKIRKSGASSRGNKGTKDASTSPGKMSKCNSRDKLSSRDKCRSNSGDNSRDKCNNRDKISQEKCNNRDRSNSEDKCKNRDKISQEKRSNRERGNSGDRCNSQEKRSGNTKLSKPETSKSCETQTENSSRQTREIASNTSFPTCDCKRSVRSCGNDSGTKQDDSGAKQNDSDAKRKTKIKAKNSACSPHRSGDSLAAKCVKTQSICKKTRSVHSNISSKPSVCLQAITSCVKVKSSSRTSSCEKKKESCECESKMTASCTKNKSSCAKAPCCTKNKSAYTKKTSRSRNGTCFTKDTSSFTKTSSCTKNAPYCAKTKSVYTKNVSESRSNSEYESSRSKSKCSCGSKYISCSSRNNSKVDRHTYSPSGVCQCDKRNGSKDSTHGKPKRIRCPGCAKKCENKAEKERNENDGGKLEKDYPKTTRDKQDLDEPGLPTDWKCLCEKRSKYLHKKESECLCEKLSKCLCGKRSKSKELDKLTSTCLCRKNTRGSKERKTRRYSKCNMNIDLNKPICLCGLKKVKQAPLKDTLSVTKVTKGMCLSGDEYRYRYYGSQQSILISAKSSEILSLIENQEIRRQKTNGSAANVYYDAKDETAVRRRSKKSVRRDKRKKKCSICGQKIGRSGIRKSGKPSTEKCESRKLRKSISAPRLCACCLKAKDPPRSSRSKGKLFDLKCECVKDQLMNRILSKINEGSVKTESGCGLKDNLSSVSFKTARTFLETCEGDGKNELHSKSSGTCKQLNCKCKLRGYSTSEEQCKEVTLCDVDLRGNSKSPRPSTMKAVADAGDFGRKRRCSHTANVERGSNVKFQDCPRKCTLSCEETTPKISGIKQKLEGLKCERESRVNFGPLKTKDKSKYDTPYECNLRVEEPSLKCSTPPSRNSEASKHVQFLNEIKNVHDKIMASKCEERCKPKHKPDVCVIVEGNTTAVVVNDCRQTEKQCVTYKDLDNKTASNCQTKQDSCPPTGDLCKVSSKKQTCGNLNDIQSSTCTNLSVKKEEKNKCNKNKGSYKRIVKKIESDIPKCCSTHANPKVEKEKCKSKPEDKCNSKPGDKCNSKPIDKCNSKPVVKCKSKPEDLCKSKPEDKCKKNLEEPCKTKSKTDEREDITDACLLKEFKDIVNLFNKNDKIQCVASKCESTKSKSNKRNRSNKRARIMLGKDMEHRSCLNLFDVNLEKFENPELVTTPSRTPQAIRPQKTSKCQLRKKGSQCKRKQNKENFWKAATTPDAKRCESKGNVTGDCAAKTNQIDDQFVVIYENASCQPNVPCPNTGLCQPCPCPNTGPAEKLPTFPARLSHTEICFFSSQKQITKQFKSRSQIAAEKQSSGDEQCGNGSREVIGRSDTISQQEKLVTRKEKVVTVKSRGCHGNENGDNGMGKELLANDKEVVASDENQVENQTNIRSVKSLMSLKIDEAFEKVYNELESYFTNKQTMRDTIVRLSSIEELSEIVSSTDFFPSSLDVSSTNQELSNLVSYPQYLFEKSLGEMDQLQAKFENFLTRNEHLCCYQTFNQQLTQETSSLGTISRLQSAQQTVRERRIWSRQTVRCDKFSYLGDSNPKNLSYLHDSWKRRNVTNRA
ncbi:hypothetical protein M8J76_008064 [Diaphorina citri]|nr:hypothetical protein M8J76_008064 [Diaphorina citri]